MKIRFTIILGFLVFFASIGITVVGASLVYAELVDSLPMTITVDKESYSKGNTISIVGDVGVKDSESLATISIYRPDYKIVTLTHIMPVDGIVSYSFKAGSGNMDVSGEYIIQLKYGVGAFAKVFYFNATEIPVIQMKTIGDDAPFFGIFVYVDNLFSWIIGK